MLFFVEMGNTIKIDTVSIIVEIYCKKEIMFVIISVLLLIYIIEINENIIFYKKLIDRHIKILLVLSKITNLARGMRILATICLTRT